MTLGLLSSTAALSFVKSLGIAPGQLGHVSEEDPGDDKSDGDDSEEIRWWPLDRVETLRPVGPFEGGGAVLCVMHRMGRG